MKKKKPFSKKEAEKIAYEKWLLSLEKLAPNFSSQPLEKKGRQTLTDYKLSPPPGRSVSVGKSRVTAGASTAPLSSPQYTGTKVLGIGTMHKSNMVPIFAEEEAKDIATMRRN